jgi:hypothetical protein
MGRQGYVGLAIKRRRKMGRILKGLGVLTLIVFLASPAFGLAGWTISTPEPQSWRNGQVMYRITIAYVQAAAATGAEVSLVTEMELDLGKKEAEWWIDKINGGILYEVVTDPGTQPDNTYALGFDCELNGALLDLAARSATVTEHADFGKDLGYNPVFWNDIQIDIADLGSAADATTIYIYIVK